MNRLRQAIRQLREWQQAKRDYRALCAEGRAAHIRVEIRIHPDDDEWTGLDGITGIKTTIPLTPAGKRYVHGILRKIEETCIRAVLKANRDAARAAESACADVQASGQPDSVETRPDARTAPHTPQPEPAHQHRNEDTGRA